MKKTPKRLLGLLLGAAMAFLAIGATTMPAQADPTPGDITVSAPEGQSLVGQTITLYKVFDATWDGHNAYAYQLDTDFLGTGTQDDFLADVSLAVTEDENTFATVADLITYMTGTPTDSEIQAFAEALWQWSDENDSVETAHQLVADTTEEPVVFDNLALGYYLVTGAVATEDGTVPGTVTSAAVLLTNDENCDIELKVGIPTIDKWVHDSEWNEWGKATDASIGDDVQFMLTSAVPNMAAFTSYTFAMHDSLDGHFNQPALTATNFKVTIGGEELTYGDEYTVTLDDPQPTTGTDFTIDFTNFIQYKTQPGDAIVVTYSATLNDTALISDTGDLQANVNDVYLEYSNNPHDGGHGTNTTIKHRVKVYSFKFKIFKCYDDGTPNEPIISPLGALVGLAGAHFELRTVADDESTAIGFTNPAPGVYKANTADTTGDNTDLVSGDDGYIYLIGLATGTYYVVETQAPFGYNPLELPVNVKIVRTVDGDDYIVDYTDSSVQTGMGNLNRTLPDGQLDIQNTTGGKLPGTGGMGTTIFTVTGLAIMLAAAAVLITRRKMTAAKAQ